MNSPKHITMTLTELASESGVAARTIRYYIARGLVDGPRGGGRGAAYDEQHLERLEEIYALKQRGLSLQEIQRKLGEAGLEDLPEPDALWSYRIADDVRVEVRGNVSPWRMHRIQKLLKAMQAELNETEEGEDK